MSTPSIRLSPRRIAMTPGRSGMSSARRPSSSSRSRPSSIGRVSRREESLAPNTRSPFDVYIKADELMFMDVCDVSSVRLFELVNVPAPFIFDRSVLANIPTMPYRLRHSVVVRFERHNVGVFRHPTNEPLVVIPFTCLTDVIAFESDMAGIHGIRVDGDDGLSISFVMDDTRRRVLLFKLMALGMNCELPPYMDVIRSRRSASRPNSTHRHRSVQHNQPFENANGDVLSVGREPTPPYETEGMEQGAGCTTHPSSDQSGKSENPTSNHEESGTNVYTRSLTHHSNQSDTINRPTETMPTTHDVHAATMKAQRRQEVETRLELERRKRIQGLSHSN